MNISMSALLLTSARAVILGLALGVLYDAVRIVKCLLCVVKYGSTRRFARVYDKGVYDIFPKKNSGVASYVLTAIFDILFSLAVTISFVLFLYAFNHGIFRWFILLSCIAGFAAYHVTLGRLLIRITDAASDALRLIINISVYVLFLPFVYVARLASKLYSALFAPAVNKIARRIDKIKNRRYTLKCIKELDRFFDFQVKG